MQIYILLLFILFTCVLIGFDNTKRKKIFMIIIFSILTLIAMLRSWKVGVDTEQYYRNFTVIANLGWDEVDVLRYESGYFYLCKILSCISKDPHILIIISSFIIIPSVGRFIYKYSSNVALSTFIYITLNIYFFHLTGMRQSLAIAILLYGIDFLLERKNFKFMLIVIIASLFHSSAVILIVLIWINKLKYGRKTYFNTIFTAIIGFIFYKPVFGIISQILPKYQGYITSTFGESNYFGALLQFIVGLTVYTFCNKFYFFKDNEKQNNISRLALRCVSITVCLQAMTMRMNIIGRMSPYFWIFSIIAFPDAIKSIKSKNKSEWILIVLFVLFLYWLIIGIYRPEWNGVIPYYTLFRD